MWDLFLSVFINFMLLIYNFLGQQTIVAITIVTLIARLITLPLTLKQQQTSQNMQKVQPKMQELQKKYANDKEKLAQEQMKLYQEAGINPLGGCLPLVIQMPILFALYQSIIRVLAVSPMELLRLSQNIYMPELTRLIPLNSTFLWLDLGQPDPYFVLTVLVVLTSWLSQKMLTPPSTDERSAAMNQQMQLMMPLMFGFISMSYASGLSIYFIISNLVTMLQYFILRNDRFKPEEDAGKDKKKDKKDKKKE
ncbi:MAG: membrane protein insertase YidC [Anaerolineae bacterium]|nr:membrane protein insertase YidC [Anaerolineae bacterium]